MLAVCLTTLPGAAERTGRGSHCLSACLSMLSVCLCCLAQPGVEAEVDGREAGLAQQVHRVADVELARPEYTRLHGGHNRVAAWALRVAAWALRVAAWAHRVALWAHRVVLWAHRAACCLHAAHHTSLSAGTQRVAWWVHRAASASPVAQGVQKQCRGALPCRRRR